MLVVVSARVNFIGFYWGRGAVADSIEHSSRVQEIMGSNPWSIQTNDLSNVYLSLPSQVLGIIRIGQGLVGSVSN